MTNTLLKDVIADINRVDSHWLVSILANRGVHALLVYRISNYMHRHKFPIIPLILTRIIHILYAIDIDYRCKIDGGVLIVHGVGVVIGRGCYIMSGVKIYHGVTMGILDDGKEFGFPKIGKNTIIGAGAKILGPIFVGNDVFIGANAVVIRNVPDYHVSIGVPATNIARKMND